MIRKVVPAARGVVSNTVSSVVRGVVRPVVRPLTGRERARKVVVPAPESPLLRAGAAELGRMIRRREVSPVEVLQAHFDRIDAVNPHINAVVEHCRARALDEAHAWADRVVHDDPANLPPLAGVPCTIKEHFAVEGMRQTGGLWRRRDVIAGEDAVLVARMRQAGMVVMGTTNVPEALMWFETLNRIYGRTTNAYSIDHLSGGSSGGEGAIVGAGGSPLGLGGDIGGSIRNPAFFNGVVGHKATGGRIPETGSWPGVTGALARYKVCGPLARRVEDVVALMPHLAYPDGEDLSVDGPPWGTSPAFSAKKVRVYVFDDNGIVSPSADVAAAVDKTALELRSRGFHVERWRPPGIEQGLQLWLGALDQGDKSFLDSLGDGGDVALGRNWLRLPFGKSEHIFPSLVLATMERAMAGAQGQSAKWASLAPNLQRAIEQKLGDDGVLVFPAFHRAAMRHGADALAAVLGFTYCAAINPLELPATAVPVGHDDLGLPLGVQVVGKRNNDHLTLWVAAQIEAALGGWRPGPITGWA